MVQAPQSLVTQTAATGWVKTDHKVATIQPQFAQVYNQGAGNTSSLQATWKITGPASPSERWHITRLAGNCGAIAANLTTSVIAILMHRTFGTFECDHSIAYDLEPAPTIPLPYAGAILEPENPVIITYDDVTQPVSLPVFVAMLAEFPGYNATNWAQVAASAILRAEYEVWRTDGDV